MRFRKSTCPAASAPCTWNACFAMSKPIVLTCSTDASFGGSSTPPLWHADAVGGRPLHHPYTVGLGRAAGLAPIEFVHVHTRLASALQVPATQCSGDQQVIMLTRGRVPGLAAARGALWAEVLKLATENWRSEEQ